MEKESELAELTTPFQVSGLQLLLKQILQSKWLAVV